MIHSARGDVTEVQLCLPYCNVNPFLHFGNSARGSKLPDSVGHFRSMLQQVTVIHSMAKRTLSIDDEGEFPIRVRPKNEPCIPCLCSICTRTGLS